MPHPPLIVWFRQDLRCTDNPALFHAAETGGPVIPVFLWTPEEEAPWAPGAAGQWYLHHALTALGAQLKTRGSRLVVRKGASSLDLLRALIEETGAGGVYWNRRYEPAVVQRDRRIKEALKGADLQARSFNASLLFEPGQVETNAGGPYKVFTPFWKKCLSLADQIPDPFPAPEALPAPDVWPEGQAVADLGLLPKYDWDDGIEAMWTPGEEGAQERLKYFLDEEILDYHEDRNRPDRYGTSRLSPHLHWGDIGPRQVWDAVHRRTQSGQRTKGEQVFLSEIGWREFSYQLLYAFPETPAQPLREQYADFPWRTDAAALKAWQKGRTGYPIVDAGMRELWHRGWMHNRVRMIVASFLIKDLLIPWQEGARWFWDTLVGADLANNTQGWQWVAGSGADAAPYFRVFNPVSQGKRYDPQGAYVRRWVPELEALPPKYLHAPWTAPAEVLAEAGVTLGETYPHPIVDHAEARERALAAYDAI